MRPASGYWNHERFGNYYFFHRLDTKKKRRQRLNTLGDKEIARGEVEDVALKFGVSRCSERTDVRSYIHKAWVIARAFEP